MMLRVGVQNNEIKQKNKTVFLCTNLLFFLNTNMTTGPIWI